MKMHVWVAVMALSVGGAAFAQAAVPKDPLATPRIDAREVRQQKRIDQGVASGQLTVRETRRLEKGEAHIDAVQARAKADGTVTAQERRHLTTLQNRESRAIAREKHDKQHS